MASVEVPSTKSNMPRMSGPAPHVDCVSSLPPALVTRHTSRKAVQSELATTLREAELCFARKLAVAFHSAESLHVEDDLRRSRSSLGVRRVWQAVVEQGMIGLRCRAHFCRTLQTRQLLDIRRARPHARRTMAPRAVSAQEKQVVADAIAWAHLHGLVRLKGSFDQISQMLK